MELYWLLRIPMLHTFGEYLFWVAFILFLIVLMAAVLDEMSSGPSELEDKHVRKLGNFFLLLMAIGALIWILCPDQTQLALMMGWDAIKSNSVQEVIEILKNIYMGF